MPKLVTQDDIDVHQADIIAEGLKPWKIGDLMFMLTDRNQYGNLYEVGSWPTAANGASIHIEGGAGFYNAIEIGSSAALTVPGNAANPNRVQFFKGRLNNKRTGNTRPFSEIQIYNLNAPIIDFESNTYPGLRDGWGSGRSGTFGLRGEQEYKLQNAMGLKVENSLGTMEILEIRGVEMTKGSFAKIRSSFAVNMLTKVRIERCWLDRSGGGEGIYHGSTVDTGPWPNHANLKINDNIISFTAAELLQLGQIGENSSIFNNIFFCGAIDLRAAFQPFQDTGVQLDFNQGNGIFKNNILMGYGSSGIHIFNKDASAQGIVFGNGQIVLLNNAVGHGKKGHAFRIAESCYKAKVVVVKDNDVFAPANNYQDVGTISNYHMELPDPTWDDDNNPGTPNVSRPVSETQIIGGNWPNDAKSILDSSKTNVSARHFAITRFNVPEPQFINSGFDGINIDKITRWHAHYTLGIYYSQSDTSINPSLLTDGGSVSMVLRNGGSFAANQKVRVKSRGSDHEFYATVVSLTGSPATALSLNNISGRVGALAKTDWDVYKTISYTTEDFVFLHENNTSLPYALYHCILAHDGHPTLRPDLTVGTHWELVWWDANGKNMYDPAYNGIPVTTDYGLVAGDFRLVPDTYHADLKRGLSCNPQSTAKTMMGWQWKQTENGTIRDIPGAYEPDLKIEDYSYLWPGRYVRYWVKRKKASGVFDAQPTYSPWHLLT